MYWFIRWLLGIEWLSVEGFEDLLCKIEEVRGSDAALMAALSPECDDGWEGSANIFQVASAVRHVGGLPIT